MSTRIIQCQGWRWVWLIMKAGVPLFELCHTVHQEFISSPVDSTISVNVSQMFSLIFPADSSSTVKKYVTCLCLQWALLWNAVLTTSWHLAENSELCYPRQDRSEILCIEFELFMIIYCREKKCVATFSERSQLLIMQKYAYQTYWGTLKMTMNCWNMSLQWLTRIWITFLYTLCGQIIVSSLSLV